MSWQFVGKNIYLNDVFENEKGQRKLIRNKKDFFEKENIFSIEFNRINNQKNSQQLIENLFNKTFLNSHQNSLSNIFNVFYSAHIKHLKNSESIANLKKEFLDKVKQQQFLLFIENWKESNKNYQHIEWQKWLKLKNSNDYLLGIQYGLGRYLESKKTKILELGLNQDLNACSLKCVDRIIYAKEQTFYSFSPVSLQGEQDYLNKNNPKNYLSVEIDKLLSPTSKKSFGFNQKFNVLKTVESNENRQNIEVTSKNPRKAKNDFKNNLEQILNNKTIKVIWSDKNQPDYLFKLVPFLLEQHHKFIFVSNEFKDDIQTKLFSCLNNKSFKSFKNSKDLKHPLNSTIYNNNNEEELQEQEKENIVQRKIIVDDLTNKNVLGVVWFFNCHQKSNLKEIVTLEDFCGNEKGFWKEQDVNIDIYSTERELYQPLSKATLPTGMVSSKIANEIHSSLLQIQKEKGNIDKWIARLLKVEVESLKDRLSSEQIDAISLGVYSLLKNKGLIIADETGFGKGRILAAISIIGLLLNKTVVFFTENKQLFSDFYRDIVAVKEEDKIIPLVLNQSGKIYDPNGELIVKNKTNNKFKEMIEEKTEWNKGEHKFIITNYAQINRKGTQQPKMKFLENLMGEDAWIILDESHNASGDSNINKNLSYLIEKASGVIFSSATYAKTEEKLAIYDKALPLSNIAKKFIKISLFGDNGDLRELLAKEMASQGNFIRREHPPIKLPEVLFVDNEEIQAKINTFVKMWQKIFSFVERREEMFGFFSARSWLTIGAVLQRSIREFSMLCKIKELPHLIEQFIQSDEKVVLVTEITFEAILKNLVEKHTFSFEETENSEENEKLEINEDENKEKNKEVVYDEEPTWNWKWVALLEDLMDEEKLNKELYFRKKDPDFSVEKFYQIKEMLDKEKVELQEYILSLDFFGLSPLDELRNLLKQKNIKMGELSGRTYQIEKKNNQWHINNKLEKKERTLLVNDFNSGLLDVMLITRAGASGISLHAGAKFKDQKKRRLIELDIASNSANRLQFLGRVRRKDQVVEPEFNTLLLNTTFDIRKLEVEKRKQVLLSAHVGGRKENEVLDWISEEGEMIVDEWGKENKTWAKKIGCFNVAYNPVKRIDRALSRCLILPKNVQEDLYSRIEKGIENHTQYHFFQQRNYPLSKSVYSEKLWGNNNSIKETEVNNSILNLGYVTLNERNWFVKNVFYKKEDQLNALLNGIEEKIYQNKISEKHKIKQLIFNWEKVNKKYNTFENQKYRTMVLDKVKELFSQFNFGSEFYWLFNNGLYFKKGTLVDIHFSEELFLPQYALNTISLEIYFENELNTINIPLIYFFKDNQFKLLENENFKKENYFNKNKVFFNFHTTTIEGNPILISAWNKKMQLGKIENIIDIEEGVKSILILPRNIKAQDIKTFDLPFVEEKQVLDYLFYSIHKKYESKKEALLKSSYLNNVQSLEESEMLLYATQALSVNGKSRYFCEIIFNDVKTYKKYQNKWILKAHAFIKKREEINNRMHLEIRFDKISHVLSLLKEEGKFFFLPKQEENWFNKTIHKYI